jgi:hypothetical protein
MLKLTFSSGFLIALTSLLLSFTFTTCIIMELIKYHEVGK